MASVGELHDLANWKDGLISPAVHFDEELYRREAERVFGRAWLVVGHEDMVRKPGDYVTSYMGEVPVILVRDIAGTIHVLVNRCAHRGNQVCLFDRGNARAFTCSYHGWTYDLDGSLIGVPMERELYRGELDKAGWGLEEVPRMVNFKGLIFASFDAGAPALEQWLGEDGCWWLQTLVLVEHLGGLEALPGWHRYRSPGNWKLLSENFTGDRVRGERRLRPRLPARARNRRARRLHLPERSPTSRAPGPRGGRMGAGALSAPPGSAERLRDQAL